VTQSLLKRYFDTFAREYDPRIDWTYREPFERVLWERVVARYGVEAALDCACGTGFHLMMLSRLGVEVCGADFSAAMVERARVLGWCELKDAYERQFDMVLCVGNSLAYVESKDERARGVDCMLECVRPGGILVTECLNYEMLAEHQPPYLPVYHHEGADGSKVDVGHILTYRDGAVDTHLYLVDEDADGSVRDRMDHVRTYTVLREPYAAYLEKAGCTDVRFYSGDIDNLVDFDAGRDRRWYCVAVKGEGA